jgi:hypothetical protein
VAGFRSCDVSQGNTDGELVHDAEGEVAVLVPTPNAKRYTLIRQFAATKRLLREHPVFIEDDRPEVPGDLDPP